jgi:hypothetical protein
MFLLEYYNYLQISAPWQTEEICYYEMFGYKILHTF